MSAAETIATAPVPPVVRPARVAPVRLAELATAIGAELRGDPGATVTGITLNSGAVALGDLFVGMPGRNAHGADYAAAAIAAGAVAVLTDARGAELVDAAVHAGLPEREARSTIASAARMTRHRPRNPGDSDEASP